MIHAITILEMSRDTSWHNKPIIRAEGRAEEADLPEYRRPVGAF
jgi:hypothetical protein